MGQTSSSANIQHVPSNSSAIKSEPIKPPGPPKRPTSPPRPKIPNYVVAQNKVLPRSNPLDGRSNLRPVAQELVKFMPEIADIYQPENGEDVAMDYDVNKENQKNISTTSLKHALNGQIVTPGNDLQIAQVKNSVTSTPTGTHNSQSRDRSSEYSIGDSVNNNDSGIFESEVITNGIDVPNAKAYNGFSHIRNGSFDRNGRVKGHHRRQNSACTSLLNEQSTIPEDPREHLYNEWRKDPYTNSLPTGTSLPVKSNFDMDESYNMTYAQLAEARRKNTLDDLERRTGKKIQDLADDLADQSNVMPSPFERYSLKASPRAAALSITRSNSISTASSSDTGVSKRKKKRAPPPPNQNGIIEPPIDYELELSTHSLPPRTKRHLSIDSSTSNVSSANSIPAPPPPPVNLRKKGPAPNPGGISPRKSSTDGVTKISVSRSNSFKTPPVVQKPPRPLSELELRLQKVRDVVEDQIIKDSQEDKTIYMDKDDQKDETASMSTDTVSSMSDNLSLYSIESRTKSDIEDVKARINVTAESEGQLTEQTNEDIEEDAFKTSNKPDVKSENIKPPDGQKKLSTLLQHDIVTAAQARGSRIVKHTTPVHSKPKDEQTVFKEQLGKALSDRDDRMQCSVSIDEMLGRNKQPALTGVVIETKSENKENIDTRSTKTVESHKIVPPPVAVKKYKSTGNILDNESSPHPESTRSSEFPADWTPEHDLDSDEDMEGQVFYSHQRATSEGFKSQIIPTKVKDLNTNSIHRSGKKNRVYKQSEAVTDEKNKYGSIRKLKRTVHKGVKNAFGSISRASGKILRRQRSHQEEQQDHATSNWRLSSTSLNHIFPPANGVDYSDSDESDSGAMGVEDIRFDLPDIPNPDTQEMKRAGVAYVSGHGQLVVLPDFPSAHTAGHNDIEDEGTAPKIYRKKKKKLSYESTVRKQERQQWEEQIAEQIKAKELDIERERTRQMEMELEYRRLRDLDSQEKLQRLQTEQIQQQLSTMQQHQRLSTPAGNLHNYSQASFIPLLASNVPQPAPFNLNPNNTTMINNFTSNDVNQLSEYMRLMGIPPPSTPQQWAYLLNSVNLTTTPSPLHAQSMYQPTSAPDLSRIFTKSQDESNRHQQQTVMNVMAVGQPTMISPELSVPGQMSNEKRRMVELLSSGKSPQMNIDNATIGTLLKDFHSGTHKSNNGEKTDKSKQERSNPVYYSSDEDAEDQLSPAKTNGVAMAQVADHRELPIPSMLVPASSQIVYDSIGFKTVIFNPASPQQSPREVDDSSSGADR